MSTEIICSPDLEAYREVVADIVQPLGNEVRGSHGEVYIVKKPVRAIFVLDVIDAEQFISTVRDSRIETILTNSDYEKIRNENMDEVSINNLLVSKPQSYQQDVFGFWFIANKTKRVRSFELIRGEAYIVLCPQVIEHFSNNKDFKAALSDIQIDDLSRTLLKITLIHELGHHYTLSNILSVMGDKIVSDSNLNEGLANWFADQFLSSEERKLLAEKAGWQSASYRYYYYLKMSNFSEILKVLITKQDYPGALKVFSNIVGGQLDLNGYTVSVGGEIDFLASLSDKGGNVLAGNIKTLLPLKKGVIISPRIDRLIGRFPKGTIVISNSIEEYLDYGTLPSNVLILNKPNNDLAVLIEKHKKEGLTSDSIITTILKELNIKI